jgi:hypothetical protein
LISTNCCIRRKHSVTRQKSETIPISRLTKRAILASWASDACVVEAAPELRRSPGGLAIRFDDIMDALRALDAQFAATSAKMRTTRRRSVLDRLRSSGGDRGAQLN